MAGKVATAPPVGVTTESLVPPRISTFHSLRYRDYQYMLQGQIGASASQWMEQIARPLLILQLTNSALMVGLIAATRMLPMLLVGIWAGVLADRMDKRRMLMISQTVTFATHLVTAILILGGLINPWMVFVTTFVAGSAMAFNQPARQSLVPRMVPRESLANAVALNSAGVNLMKIGGPSIAGLVLVFFGLGDLYLFQAAIYVWVIFSTWRITVRTNEGPRSNTSVWSELLDGFRAVRTDRTIFYILLISLVMFIWGMPFQSVFVPLIAKRVLDLSDSGLGLLVSCMGAGALFGALTIATVGDNLRRRGPIMFAMLFAFCLGLLLLARADTVWLVVPALLIAGTMQTSFMSLNNAYVLGRTPIEMQGRVMSLFSLDRGLIPFGAMIGGILAESLGPQAALTVMASICLGSTVLLALFVPALRRIS